MPIPLSAVICTKNRADLLKEVLESLVRQTLPAEHYEILIIDDGSTDRTKEVVQSFAGQPPVKYFYQRSAGLASAKNHGLFASQGEIVLFLDDDDVASPNLLEEHLKTHRKWPQDHNAVLHYTTWAPRLPVTPVMNFLTEIGCFLFSYPYLKKRKILDFTYYWGGRSSSKRRFLIEHEIFNPAFRFGCEDIELGYRLSKHGLKVIYNRQAVGMMIRPVTFDEFQRRSVKQGRSQYLFHSLHDDPRVREWCGMDDFDKLWPKIETIYEKKTKAARDLDHIALMKAKFHVGLDGQTRKLLYRAYWWAFRASNLKGIAEAQGNCSGASFNGLRCSARAPR